MVKELIEVFNNLLKYIVKRINKKILWTIFLFSIIIVTLGILNNHFVNQNLINFETITNTVKSLIFMMAVLTGSYFAIDFLSRWFEKRYYKNFDKKTKESRFKNFLCSESSKNEIKFLKILFDNKLNEFFINDDFKELFINEASKIYEDGRAGLNQYIEDNIYNLKNRSYIQLSYKKCEQIYVITDFCWNKLQGSCSIAEV